MGIIDDIMPIEIIFLGSGGGRFATIYQGRSTGGVYIKGPGTYLHVDPGPTAAWQMAQVGLDPTQTDAILISHCHPDHYSDAEVLIEGMTEGTTKKRGVLIGSQSVMDGYDGMGPAVSEYHKKAVKRVETAEPGSEWEFNGFKITATYSKHTDPSTIGFKFETEHGTISYIADTDLTQKVIDAHKGSRLLIMSTTRPLYSKIPFHLSTEDAAYILDHVTPEMAILTHFGLKSLKEGPRLQADWVTKKSGIKTYAAEDLMHVTFGETISVKFPPVNRNNKNNNHRYGRSGGGRQRRSKSHNNNNKQHQKKQQQ